MFAKVDILRNIEMDGCPSVYRTFLNHLPCDSKIITLHFTDKKDIFQVAKNPKPFFETPVTYENTVFLSISV